MKGQVPDQSTVGFGSTFLSSRSSEEILTIFVNLYANTDFVAFLPGGRPQTASITISNSLAENNSISHSGFYPMNISALNFNPVRRNVNLILEHNNKEWLL
jgi:hypothetical protein